MKAISDKEVGTFEAKNRLSALVDEASRGRRIWITRHGKRVALLSSGSGTSAPSTSSLVEQARRIRQLGNRGPESLKELIREGQR